MSLSPYSFRMGSEFLMREDLENLMTLVFSGFSFIFYLAPHFAYFLAKSPYAKILLQNCTFLLTAHRAVTSANWDFKFCQR